MTLLRVESLPGDPLADTARDMLLLARRCKVDVICRFNGVDIVAHMRDCSVLDLEKQYERGRKRKEGRT
jgi:hypothetical protein